PVEEVPAETPSPVIRTLVDEELGQWLARASRDGSASLGLQVEYGPAGVTGFGIASIDDSVYVPWATGRMDYEALNAWLASDSPKYMLDSKRQLKQLMASGITLAGIAFDTSLADWLMRPSGKNQDLAGQVYTHLGEAIAVADPNQLVPDVEALS